MTQPDTHHTNAEVLVHLASSGRLDWAVGRAILQAVYDSAAGPQAFAAVPSVRTERAGAKPKAQEYFFPLGALQADIIGEYMELEIDLCGETTTLRGYVRSDEQENAAWLGVALQWYARHERPPLIRALAGLELLPTSLGFRHHLIRSYPASHILKAVRTAYLKRATIRHPEAYITAALEAMHAKAAPQAI